MIRNVKGYNEIINFIEISVSGVVRLKARLQGVKRAERKQKQLYKGQNYSTIAWVDGTSGYIFRIKET